MKKLFLSILAVAALASCSKTESAYVDQDQEIKVSPVTAMATKANVLAAIDGTAYPTKENFDVYAYWANVNAGSTFTSGTDYLTGTTTGVEFTNKGLYWGGTTTYYWPKNGSLRFAAYSPSSVDMTHNLATDTYAVANYEQPYETSQTWDLLVAPTSPSYTAQTAAENVSVVFEHALSWITLQVVAKDADAAKAFDIKKVTINDVVTKANLSAVMSGSDKGMNWTLTDTKNAYKVFEGSQVVTTEANVIENVHQGTLIIPQGTTSVTVDYTQNALEGTPALEGQSVTVDLVLDKDNTPWEAGKHYIYTLIFGLDEILINPSVVDWEDVEVGEIDTDKNVSNVSTPAQLAAAFAKGGKVVLQSDITIDETINVAKGTTVVLDLNGKKLTNKLENTATDVIVVAEGGELTINGNGEIEAVTGNDGFTVISEGLLIINDGTFKSGIDENSEPNAVIYARGNGKVFVNGGNFPNDNASKFVLNKKDADRETTVIEVAGGTYGAFNPADNAAEQAGTNFVKEGFAVVKEGDTYTVVPAADYVETINQGGDVTLYTNLAVNEAVVAAGNLNLNLNGKTLSVNEAIYVDGKASSLITASAGSNVVINGIGLVDASGYGDYAAEVRQGGNLTIKNGHFIGDVTAIYAVEGVVTIEGGYFEVTTSVYGTTYLLNLSDQNGKNGKAKIVVKGGTFKGFDPASNNAENPAVNFVADGYKSVNNGDGTYTVVAE